MKRAARIVVIALVVAFLGTNAASAKEFYEWIQTGTPIRVMFRTQGDKNPYKDKKNFGTPSRLRKHLEKKG